MGKKRTAVGKFLHGVGRVIAGKPANEPSAEKKKQKRIKHCRKMGSGCSFEEKRKLGMYTDLDIGPDAELRKAQQIKGFKSGNPQQTKGVKSGNPQQTKGIKNGN